MSKNSLPADWVDRIFFRMSGVYGKEFLSQYKVIDEFTGADVGLENAKVVWAEELATFQGWPEAIAYALENLPDRPPNVIKFRELCRHAPAKQSNVMITNDPTKASHQKAREAIAGLRSMMNMPSRGDNRDWARKILREHEQGIHKTPTVLSMARKALGS